MPPHIFSAISSLALGPVSSPAKDEFEGSNPLDYTGKSCESCKRAVAFVESSGLAMQKSVGC